MNAYYNAEYAKRGLWVRIEVGQLLLLRIININQ